MQKTSRQGAAIPFIVLLTVLFTVLMFCDLKNFVTVSQQGLILFAQNVLPVLFPFFFISSLLAGLGFFSMVSPMLNPLCRRLYTTGGPTGGVLLVSLLSGYPTGARLLSELYLRGEINRSDAIKTATWTSTCSPAFVIGSVGTALYGSTSVGLIIFSATALGALLNGFIYKNIHFHDKQSPAKGSNLTTTRRNMHSANTPPLDEVLNTALYGAIQSILIVGGWIVLFFIAAAQLQAIMALPHGVDVVISSVLEMTTGVFRAGREANILIPCAIISFGGLSVAMQGQVFFRIFKMPIGFYFLYKTTHTILAVLLCAAMALLLL